MLRRIFWISLLAIGVLIFISITFRGPTPAAAKASQVGSGAETKAVKAELARAVSRGTRPSLKETREQILQDAGPLDRLQVIGSQAPQSNGLIELFDGTLAPEFAPDPPIRDYGDLQFFTTVMSPNISEQMLPLRALIGVSAN